MTPFEAALHAFEEAFADHHLRLGRNDLDAAAIREHWDRVSKARSRLLEFDPAKLNK
jgi:hypothetical protein